MKHCIDCKHFVPDPENPSQARCDALIVGMDSGGFREYATWMVLGGEPVAIPTPALELCLDLRLPGFFCGPEAAHFEPKTQ